MMVLILFLKLVILQLFFKDDNFNKQKKQTNRGRGRGASWGPEKDPVTSINGRGKPLGERKHHSL